jgi:hypothetical protein
MLSVWLIKMNSRFSRVESMSMVHGYPLVLRCSTCRTLLPQLHLAFPASCSTGCRRCKAARLSDGDVWHLEPDHPGLRSYESPAQYEQIKPQYEFARQQGAYNCGVKLRCSNGGTTLPPSSMVWSPFQSPNGHAIQCFQTTWNYR